MKNSIKLGTAVIALSVLANILPTLTSAQDSVYSVNIVGFQKQEFPSPNELALSASPFQTGETQTLLSIFGTNTLKQSASLFSCDRVILFDSTSQTYQAWAQYTDGKFYKANSVDEWNVGIEGNPEVPSGVGFWIRSAVDAPGERSLTYVGDVNMDENSQLDISSGLQILAYPFSSDVDIQETGFNASGAAKSDNYFSADRISVFENGAYTSFGLASDGQWYPATTLDEWNNAVAPSVRTLMAGQAFFYRAQQLFSWSETNKYLTSINQ